MITARRLDLVTLAAWGQGAYYVLTGLWPLLSMSTFEAVTGPKTDDWLVHTVGVLVLCTGGVLLIAAFRHKLTAEVLALAISNAFGLIMIDVVYVGNGTISPIYLADAVAELGLIVMYTLGIREQGPGTRKAGARF